MKLDLNQSEAETVVEALTELMVSLRTITHPTDPTNNHHVITEEELLMTGSPKRKEHYLNAKWLRLRIRRNL